MKEIKTTYGTYKAGAEPGLTALHNKKEEAIGANIYLKFTPNELVTDAEQFGFVQVAQVKTGGSTKPSDPDQKRNRVKKNGKSQNYFVDQIKGCRNPLYATTDKANAGKENQLDGYKDADVHEAKDTESNNYLIKDRKWAGFGQFGYKKKDGTGQDATFQDAPHFDEPEAGAAEHFETTVLVTSGTQAGTYMGSIKWGFELEEAGKIKLEEPELVSAGAASKTFFDAAKKWNKTSTQVKETDKKGDEKEVKKHHIQLPGTN